MSERATRTTLKNLAEINRLLQALAEDAKWMDGIGQVRRVRGTTGGGDGEIHDLAGQLCSCLTDLEQAQREARGDTRAPRCHPCDDRAVAAQVHDDIAEALRRLQRAWKRSGTVLGRGANAGADEDHPRVAKTTEIARARRYAQGRRERGEHIPTA